MSELTTFDSGARAAVIGASGGIGAALTNALVADPGIDHVHALSRRGRPPRADSTSSIDITDEASIAAAVETCGNLDLVIVASGVLHDPAGIRPEKRMCDLDGEVMQRVFAANTIGPALIAKHFLPRLRRGRKTVFAALSARVGSISDNRLGGWASYRASKAALNMLLKTFAIEHSRTRPDSVVVGLHPGTVDTALSKPFQGNVPDNKLLTPAIAAEYLLGVIDRVTSSDSGGFFAWDGARIDY